MRTQKLLKQHDEITDLQHQLYKKELEDKLTYSGELKNRPTTIKAKLIDIGLKTLLLLVGIILGVAFSI